MKHMRYHILTYQHASIKCTTYRMCFMIMI